MLAELQSLHSEIERQLVALERMTALREPPPMATLASVRLALTRASRKRLQLLSARAFDAAGRDAEAPQRAAIERLRLDGLAIIARSASHIGCWTPIEVGKRWPDYCAASAKMRASMRERLAVERAVLVPLLRDEPTAERTAA